MKRFFKEEKAQFMTEYALVMAGVLFVAILSFRMIIRAYQAGYDGFLSRLIMMLDPLFNYFFK